MQCWKWCGGTEKSNLKDLNYDNELVQTLMYGLNVNWMLLDLLAYDLEDSNTCANHSY